MENFAKNVIDRMQFPVTTVIQTLQHHRSDGTAVFHSFFEIFICFQNYKNTANVVEQKIHHKINRTDEKLKRVAGVAYKDFFFLPGPGFLFSDGNFFLIFFFRFC